MIVSHRNFDDLDTATGRFSDCAADERHRPFIGKFEGESVIDGEPVRLSAKRTLAGRT